LKSHTIVLKTKDWYSASLSICANEGWQHSSKEQNKYAARGRPISCR
jgi:hypothetical protein